MSKLNIKRVTEIIGDEYKRWRGGDIVKIQTQTGSGKTHFIVNSLTSQLFEYEFNPEMNDKMLILCNRTNLKRQLKKDLCKKFNIKIPSTIQDLDELEKIHNVTVMSYQTLNELIIREKYEKDFNMLLNYKYIVCDEIHYVLEDSFTTKTQYSLDVLIKEKYSQTIRIFMSATMDSIDETINSIFNNNQKGAFGTGIKEIHTYKTGIDYSYINPYYFYKDDSLINRIVNDKTDEKWIIFISDIKNGRNLKKELNDNGINSEFIHAKSRSKEIDNIIMDEKFNCKVLITTTILNNGVNINDEKVKHIVCKSYNLTTFIQEVGRVRVDINNPYEINLYLPTINKKQWLGIRKTYDDIIKECTLLVTDPTEFKRQFNDDYDSLSKGTFRLDENNEWQINETRLMYAKEQQEFINSILDNYDKHKEKTYIIKQLQSLGLDKDISNKKLLENIQNDGHKDYIKEYVLSKVNTYLDKKEQNKLIDIMDLRDSKNRKKKGLTTLKGYLLDNFDLTIESKPVRIKSKNNKLERVWIIMHIK